MDFFRGGVFTVLFSMWKSWKMRKKRIRTQKKTPTNEKFNHPRQNFHPNSFFYFSGFSCFFRGKRIKNGKYMDGKKSFWVREKLRGELFSVYPPHLFGQKIFWVWWLDTHRKIAILYNSQAQAKWNSFFHIITVNIAIVPWFTSSFPSQFFLRQIRKILFSSCLRWIYIISNFRKFTFYVFGNLFRIIEAWEKAKNS